MTVSSSGRERPDPGYENAQRRSTLTRQEQLVKHLNAHHFVDINSLVDKLGASVSTIRRDLSDLEKQGLLRRTHGGAIRVAQVASDSEASVREVLNVAEKEAIGARAAEMVVDGDTVLIDGGTTSRQVASRLAGNPSLTFVTNGIDIVDTLVAGGTTNVHFIGGEYIPVNRSFGGALAAEMVRRFNVDKAFLCITSVDIRRGYICNGVPQMGSVQQAMIEIAQSVIVVADHSKFGKAALTVIAPLDDIDCIVTGQATRSILAQSHEKIRAKCVFA